MQAQQLTAGIAGGTLLVLVLLAVAAMSLVCKGGNAHKNRAPSRQGSINKKKLRMQQTRHKYSTAGVAANHMAGAAVVMQPIAEAQAQPPYAAVLAAMSTASDRIMQPGRAAGKAVAGALQAAGGAVSAALNAQVQPPYAAASAAMWAAAGTMKRQGLAAGEAISGALQAAGGVVNAALELPHKVFAWLTQVSTWATYWKHAAAIYVTHFGAKVAEERLHATGQEVGGSTAVMVAPVLDMEDEQQDPCGSPHTATGNLPRTDSAMERDVEQPETAGVDAETPAESANDAGSPAATTEEVQVSNKEGEISRLRLMSAQLIQEKVELSSELQQVQEVLASTIEDNDALQAEYSSLREQLDEYRHKSSKVNCELMQPTSPSTDSSLGQLSLADGALAGVVSEAAEQAREDADQAAAMTDMATGLTGSVVPGKATTLADAAAPTEVVDEQIVEQGASMSSLTGAADVTATSDQGTTYDRPPCLMSEPREPTTITLNITIINSPVDADSATAGAPNTATPVIALMNETAAHETGVEPAAASRHEGSTEGMVETFCPTPEVHGSAVGAPLLGDKMDASKAGTATEAVEAAQIVIEVADQANGVADLATSYVDTVVASKVGVLAGDVAPTEKLIEEAVQEEAVTSSPAGATDVTATTLEATTHDSLPCLMSRPCEEATDTTIASGLAADSATTTATSTATALVTWMDETITHGSNVASAAPNSYDSSIEGMAKPACNTPHEYGLAVGAPLLGDNMDASKAVAAKLGHLSPEVTPSSNWAIGVATDNVLAASASDVEPAMFEEKQASSEAIAPPAISAAAAAAAEISNGSTVELPNQIDAAINSVPAEGVNANAEKKKKKRRRPKRKPGQGSANQADNVPLEVVSTNADKKKKKKKTRKPRRKPGHTPAIQDDSKPVTGVQPAQKAPGVAAKLVGDLLPQLSTSSGWAVGVAADIALPASAGDLELAMFGEKQASSEAAAPAAVIDATAEISAGSTVEISNEVHAAKNNMPEEAVSTNADKKKKRRRPRRKPRQAPVNQDDSNKPVTGVPPAQEAQGGEVPVAPPPMPQYGGRMMRFKGCQQHLELKLHILVISKDDVEDEEEDPIGIGGQGSVFGSAIPVMDKHGEEVRRSVAVKYPKDGCGRELWRELCVGQQLNHRNCVKIIAAITDPDDENLIVGLAYERMRGDFHAWSRFMKKKFNRNPVYSERVRILRDIIKGVKHMHSSRLLHQDLKMSNTLLDWDDEGNITSVKVGDYGCVDFIGNTVPNTGTIYFAAPETMRTRVVRCADGSQIYVTLFPMTEMADVYSLGALMDELATGLWPWWWHKDYDKFTKLKTSNELEKLFKPFGEYAAVSDRYYSLLNRCLDNDPLKRPTTDQLLDKVEQLLEEQAASEEQQKVNLVSVPFDLTAYLNATEPRLQ